MGRARGLAEEPVERLAPRRLTEGLQGALAIRGRRVEELGLGAPVEPLITARRLAAPPSSRRGRSCALDVTTTAYRPAPHVRRVVGVTVLGVGGHPITVEAFVGRGLPTLILTGLPGTAVQDARDRIRPAVEHAGLQWPLRRVVVNLAPGNLGRRVPGSTSRSPSPCSSPRHRCPSAPCVGSPSRGAVAQGRRASRRPASSRSPSPRPGRPGRRRGARAATRSRPRRSRACGSCPATRLDDVAGFLKGTWAPPQVEAPAPSAAPSWSVDLADVRGQLQARRAIEVAAAGGHNLLMVGSPGAGKTMLARRLATILPGAHARGGVGGQPAALGGGPAERARGCCAARPFRAPHHTISTAGLLGGGSTSLRPGEVSLAHARRAVPRRAHGVPARRDRGPAPTPGGRAGRRDARRGSVEFPARFTLVAAANPCPCGFDGDALRAIADCPSIGSCSTGRSCPGPLLDRIDLRLRVPRLTKEELLGLAAGRILGRSCASRVQEARERQRRRYARSGVRCNAHLPGPSVRREARLEPGAERAPGARGRVDGAHRPGVRPDAEGGAHGRRSRRGGSRRRRRTSPRRSRIARGSRKRTRSHVPDDAGVARRASRSGTARVAGPSCVSPASAG